MKIVFLVVIILFIASCSDPASKNDEDVLSGEDDDISENDGETPDDDYNPACLNEWIKIETVKDINEMFDFEVKEKTGNSKWEKGDDEEFLDLEGGLSQVLGIMKDGSLVISEFLEMEDGYSLLVILHPDGTYKRYVLNIDAEEEILLGMGESHAGKSFNLWPGYGFDEESEEIFISVTAKSKMQTSVEGEYFARPFLIKIDSDGNMSYTTWKHGGNSICSNIIQRDDKIFMTCQHWSSDPEIYFATGRMNAEINVIDGDHVFRKLLPTDYFAMNGLNIKCEKGVIYTSYSQDDDSSEPTPSYIYAIGEKDLCVETLRPEDFFDKNAFEGSPYGGEDYVAALSFLKNGEYSILGGSRFKWVHEEGLHYNNMYASLYFNHPEKDSLFTFGIKYPFFDVGEEEKMHGIYFINMYPKKDSNIIFAALVSTFDIEDKGREWITPEVLEQTNWPFQPAIAAIDMDTGEVYVKQFFVDLITGNNGVVFHFGEYIYLLVTFVTTVEEEYVFDRVLYRFSDSWLINEESKAKETRLWIEEF